MNAVDEFMASKSFEVAAPKGWKYWYHNNAAGMGEHNFKSEDGLWLQADYRGVCVIESPPRRMPVIPMEVFQKAHELHQYEKSIPCDE